MRWKLIDRCMWLCSMSKCLVLITWVQMKPVQSMISTDACVTMKLLMKVWMISTTKIFRLSRSSIRVKNFSSTKSKVRCIVILPGFATKLFSQAELSLSLSTGQWILKGILPWTHLLHTQNVTYTVTSPCHSHCLSLSMTHTVCHWLWLTLSVTDYDSHCY